MPYLKSGGTSATMRRSGLLLRYRIVFERWFWIPPSLKTIFNLRRIPSMSFGSKIGRVGIRISDRESISLLVKRPISPLMRPPFVKTANGSRHISFLNRFTIGDGITLEEIFTLSKDSLFTLIPNRSIKQINYTTWSSWKKRRVLSDGWIIF